MKNKKQKVVVAMSGGVDSSVAAALLKQAGYDVVGVFMQFWFPARTASPSVAGEPKQEKYGENRCCSLESWHEAREVARILDIPIHKLNFGKEFKKQIVDEFLKAYRRGETPNPCVACNKFIKFDLLWQKAKTIFGADYLATGHYVRLRPELRIKNYELRIKTKIIKNKVQLLRAVDLQKDQSYFLYNLNQKILPHLLFPLGGYEKSEVRALAKKMGLSVHDKKDSQEICFVGRSHYDFLQKYLKLKKGKIINEAGRELGEHRGLPFYTLGQREGIGLSGGPWYVCGFKKNKNQLVVTRDQNHSGIYQKELSATKVNWLAGAPAATKVLAGKPKFPLKCQAQIRYHARPADCVVVKSGAGVKVKFFKPQRAIMPGQSVVFYRGDELLGGGVIK